MGFLKKGSRGQGFRGSSKNNETLRQAEEDRKRVRELPEKVQKSKESKGAKV